MILSSIITIRRAMSTVVGVKMHRTIVLSADYDRRFTILEAVVELSSPCRDWKAYSLAMNQASKLKI
jgi:hypothetical protein